MSEREKSTFTGGTVFMFSGQGSQYYHMGRELFEQLPTFRSWMLKMDDVVRRLCGVSVLGSIYDDSRAKSDVLDSLTITHPGIFMIEFALSQTLSAAGITPQLLIGASLGAYVAAAVAGCITYEDALTALVNQVVALERTCPRGAMIAVLASPDLHQEPQLAKATAIAAVNCPEHFVLSAPREQLSSVERFLSSRGVAFQTLPVPYAFHSRWIDEAELPIREVMNRVSYRSACLPIACCANGLGAHRIDSEYFWSVARKPIRFMQLIGELESSAHYRYVDVGPSGSLASFLKYSLPVHSQSQVQTILSPFGNDLKRLAALTDRRSHQ